MIKNFTPQKYIGLEPLPSYVTNTRVYTLVASIPNGYDITLARLTVGESVSQGNALSHAQFESFTDHGKRAMAMKTRANGDDREFIAVKNAMSVTGVEFHPTLPKSCEAVLQALGEWFMAQNPELLKIEIVSQTCH